MKKILLPTILFIQIIACNVFANCVHLKQLIGSWKFDANGVSYHMNIDRSGKVAGYGIRIRKEPGTDDAYTLAGKYGMVYYSAYYSECQLDVKVTGNKLPDDHERFVFQDVSFRFNNTQYICRAHGVTSLAGFYPTLLLIKY